MAAFDDFLSDVNAERCWLLELDALPLGALSADSAAFGDGGFGEFSFGEDPAGETGGAVKLYYSSHGYQSRLYSAVAYLSLPGSAGNFASTPDSAATSVTGDLDIRLELAANVWTDPSVIQHVFSKNSLAASNFSWKFELLSSAFGNGLVNFQTSPNGVDATNHFSTASHGFADGAVGWLRVTLDVDNGAAGHTVTFYKSLDNGLTWQVIGAPVVTVGVIALFDSATPLSVGGHDGTDVGSMIGKVYYAELRNGIAGPVAAKFDAARGVTDSAKVVSDTGEIWTINTAGAPAARLVNEGLIAGQDPASQVWYDGRLAGDPHVVRSIVGRDGLGGLTRTFAEVELVNADGALDELTASYAIDGRGAKLWLGRPTDKRADFGVVVAGVAARSPLVGVKSLTLSLSDGLARLEVPLNSTAYAGTGGLEGGADLAGKPKPKGWGAVFNISPPLVDSVNLIYQVHDGLANDVPAVYDRAIALARGADYATQNDLLTVAPAAGDYRVWKNASGTYFRLGGAPAGTVSADLQGDASGGYVSRTADIVSRVLQSQAILAAGEIDAAAIGALNAAAPAAVGIWRGTEPDTVAAVVAELLGGVGAFGGFSRSALFTCGVIDVGGAPVAAYTIEKAGTIERLAPPEAVDPVVWRSRVAWQKNYTVQADVAAGVSQARRAFVAQAERVAKRDEIGIKSRRKLAKEYGPNGELYALEADAQTEANRRQALWGVERALYSVPLPAEALARDLGEVVTLTYPRFGLDAGVNAIILEHEILGDEVTVKVLA